MEKEFFEDVERIAMHTKLSAYDVYKLTEILKMLPNLSFLTDVKKRYVKEFIAHIADNKPKETEADFLFRLSYIESDIANDSMPDLPAEDFYELRYLVNKQIYPTSTARINLILNPTKLKGGKRNRRKSKRRKQRNLRHTRR